MSGSGSTVVVQHGLTNWFCSIADNSFPSLRLRPRPRGNGSSDARTKQNQNVANVEALRRSTRLAQRKRATSDHGGPLPQAPRSGRSSYRKPMSSSRKKRVATSSSTRPGRKLKKIARKDANIPEARGVTKRTVQTRQNTAATKRRSRMKSRMK